MENQYIEKILQSQINENTNTTTNVGIIIASPSETPPINIIGYAIRL